MSFAQRILVVEDEPVLSANLKVFLGRRSPDVRVAGDAAQAIAMIESFTPDVVVLDYGLPNVDGLKTYGEIVLRCPRQFGCVMITGYPLERLSWRANALGVHHLLCKPFALWELQRMVDRSATEAAHGPALKRPCARGQRTGTRQ